MTLLNAGNVELATLWDTDRPQAMAICIRALEATRGDIKAAAKKLQCSRQTLHNRIRENGWLAQRLKEIRKESRAREKNGK